jgi:hypothetical protein
MEAAMVRIGDAFKPVSQMLTVTFGKLVPILAEPVVKLANIVSVNFKEWAKIIDSTVVPAFEKFVAQGWNALSRAIVFFQSNSKWLVPWITEAIKFVGLWTFVLGPLANAIVLVNNALIALSLSNPWTAIALAAAVAASR